MAVIRHDALLLLYEQQPGLHRWLDSVGWSVIWSIWGVRREGTARVMMCPSLTDLTDLTDSTSHPKYCSSHDDCGHQGLGAL